MLEIHLFVNPLGPNCQHCETDVLKCRQMTAAKVQCTIVPLFNMTTIQQTIQMYGLPTNDLEVRSTVCQALYQAILDYKAAQYQGQKRARKFLLLQQKALAHNHLHYDDQLAQQLANKVPLDLEMFDEDRHGQLVKKAFNDDQQLASQMGVTSTDTAIVVDTIAPDCGIKIENFSFDRLLKFYQKLHCDHCALMHLANRCIDLKQFSKRL